MARSVVGSQFSRKTSTVSEWIALAGKTCLGLRVRALWSRYRCGDRPTYTRRHSRRGGTGPSGKDREAGSWVGRRLGSSLDSQAVLAHGARLGCGQAAYDAVFLGLSLCPPKPVKPTDDNACARVASDVGTRGDQSGSGAPAVGSRSLRPVKKRRTSAAVFDCDVSERTRGMTNALCSLSREKSKAQGGGEKA